jgi:hypothetical protein
MKIAFYYFKNLNEYWVSIKFIDIIKTHIPSETGRLLNITSEMVINGVKWHFIFGKASKIKKATAAPETIELVK